MTSNELIEQYLTPRLLLRRWRVADAPLFKAAVDASLAHLRPWLPWALDEPEPLDAVEARLAGFAAEFDAGGTRVYGIFPRDGAPEVLGGVGVHVPRHADQPPGVREIGYWLRVDATGRGYLGEALAAVVPAALAAPGVTALEARVDPENGPSVRAAERAGFALRERLVGTRVVPGGQPCDTLVFERRPDPPPVAPARGDEVPRLTAVRAAVRAADRDAPRDADGDADRGDLAEAVARGTCWVWRDAAGVAQGFVAGEPRADGGTAWTVCVHPACELSPAPHALVAHLVDVLWRRGHAALTLDLPAGAQAARLYRAAGWTDAGAGAPGGRVVLARALRVPAPPLR